MSSKAGASAAVHLHHKLQCYEYSLRNIAVIDLQLEPFTVQKAGDQKSHFGWPQMPPSHRLALTPRYRYCVYQWLGAVKDSLLWALHINWLCECCCTFGWRACSQPTILQWKSSPHSQVVKRWEKGLQKRWQMAPSPERFPRVHLLERRPDGR